MRPLLTKYEDTEAWKVDIQRSKIYSIKQTDVVSREKFEFENIFGKDCKSVMVYSRICRDIVQAVLNGYNGSIFMYGQTTSGKTYTMLGTPEDPGILPSAIRQIFRSISADTEYQYSVWVSYLEIYNEQVNDLLIPKSTNLKLSDTATGVTIHGLKQQKVSTFDEVLILMNYGEEHRSYRETNIHEHSSRSHTIFQLCIESKHRFSTDGTIKYGTLNLIDLAGSERLNEFDVRSQAMMSETGHINQSLFTLSNVILKLSENKHVPFRDSKLTRITRNSLGGNAISAIICTISPAMMNYQNTLTTLRFAKRAGSIRNKPVLNKYMSQENVDNQVKLEMIKLREELAFTQQEIFNTRNRAAERHYPERAIPPPDYYDTLRENELLRKQLSEPPEDVYFERLIAQVEQQTPVNQDSQSAWINEINRLRSSYRFDISKLQTNYQKAISQALDQSETTADFAEKPMDQSTQDRFDEIVRGLFNGDPSNEEIDRTVNDLREHHNYLNQKLDREYTQASQKSPREADSLLHNYKNSKARLEASYMNSLQDLDELVRSVGQKSDAIRF